MAIHPSSPFCSHPGQTLSSGTVSLPLLRGPVSVAALLRGRPVDKGKSVARRLLGARGGKARTALSRQKIAALTLAVSNAWPVALTNLPTRHDPLPTGPPYCPHCLKFKESFCIHLESRAPTLHVFHRNRAFTLKLKNPGGH
jgi:hypothetical protein